MIPDLAEFLLQLAFGLAIFQGLAFRANKWFIRSAAMTQFLCLTISFAALIYSFAVSDFSLKIIFENSHTLKPFLYKISGTWGNHEGSLLMLIWILSLYGFMYSVTGFNKNALSIHGLVSAGFIGFCLFTSNPFEPMQIPVTEGVGLNPLLQDIGLALHPPMLYMGYIGFALVYAIAVSALIRGEVGGLAMHLRKWGILAWSFLTLGIGLGSWWAYRELGWGGYWFWDPVENASLMPWLVGTALIHTIMISEKKQSLNRWTILLSITTFSMSLIGFFLVRSGILTSVHAFANDPERGAVILAMLILITGIPLIIYAFKAQKLKSQFHAPLISRENFILYNNLLLMVLAGTVLIGTIYPLILDAIGGSQISVGAPFFNDSFIPFALPLIFLMSLATVGNWGKMDFDVLLIKLIKPMIGAIIISVIFHLLFGASGYQSSIIFLILVLLFSGISRFLLKEKNKSYTMIISHLGLAVLALGIMFSATFKEDSEVLMSIGDEVELSGFEIKLKEVVEGQEKNYAYRRAIFDISTKEKLIRTLQPENRIFLVEQEKTTEAAIAVSALSDLYIVIGEKTKEGAFPVRIHFKPLVNLIWIGCITMFAGGMMRFLTSQKPKDG